MPVDSQHPAYVRYFPQWQRCRDVMEGTDAVKGRATGDQAVPHGSGTAYLPQPSGMQARDYQAYKTRAAFFGASGRVRQGLEGLIERKPPAIVVPQMIEAHLADITGTGVSLHALSSHLITEHLTTGRIGILVDLPEEDQVAGQVRPRWTLATAEQLINWRHMRTPLGTQVYRQVVFEEEIDEEDPTDPYRHLVIPQWRETVLEDGHYTVRIWRKVQGVTGETFLLRDERHPHRRGTPLAALPVFILNADSLDMTLGPPPLLDVVDLNLAHYRTNADFKHSLHMSSLATAYITGWENEEAEMRVGALTAWVIPPADARVGYLEPSGAGWQGMQDDMRATEAQMAVLGARLLEPQRRTIEAAETHQIRQSAELSIMEAYALAASALITKALRCHAWWAGATDDPDDAGITFTLNTDFLPTTIDAPTLTALTAAWQAGAVTQEDLYYNLVRGNVVQPGVPFAEWQRTLQAQVPAIDPRTLVPGAQEF
jgi:hypothetical protein